jgi:hypothetical protein
VEPWCYGLVLYWWVRWPVQWWFGGQVVVVEQVGHVVPVAV